MAESDNWVNPQHDYNVPFLGKPPLLFWTAAASIKLFCANEIAPRLFILLVSFVFACLMFYWITQAIGNSYAYIATIILTSSFMFYISMAAVMMDTSNTK